METQFNNSTNDDMKNKSSIYNRTCNYAKPVLSAGISFFMMNLEFIPLIFALQVWFDAGNRWEYWVTIILVAICSGISTAYREEEQNRMVKELSDGVVS